MNKRNRTKWMSGAILSTCFFFFTNLAAQTNGYYVTNGNDTIPAYIHLRKDAFGPYSFHNLYKEVRLSTDSSANEKLYLPADIKLFYVKKGEDDYLFYAKPLEENKLRFLQALVITPSTSLYSYRSIRVNGESIHYTIEKDSSYLFVYNRNHVKLKNRLREFYAGDEKILKLIEPLFKQPGFVDRDLILLFNRIARLDN